MTYIPLYIDASAFNVLVVGGGSVGTRRAKFFAEAGARVRVVAAEFSSELVKVSERTGIELLHRHIESVRDVEDLIEWADIVVIALPDYRLAAEIAEYALGRGKLVNNAVEASKGNVIVPFHATVYDGGLSIAVTSFGRSGVAARRALEKIVNVLEEDEELKLFYRVFEEAKRAAKEHIDSPGRRMEYYMALDKDDVLAEAIKRRDFEAALQRAMQLLKEFERG